MKLLKSFIFFFAMTISLNSLAQENQTIKLTILVKDKSNNPIPGAIILLDDVKQKRPSNSAGYFKIKLDKAPKEIAAFSPLFGIKKVKYNGNSNIIIQIVESKNDSYITDTNKTKAIDAIQFRNIYDYIMGKVPGVNVRGTTITIRGTSNAPLFVLNGVQVDATSFGAIVPTTIKSIKILKGPETSIYGLRGANGVIEVTTTI
tara:strand:+ start:243 stop:851 length:609 start_codon:yes stop_codon:yes gene_type:complete